MLQCRTVFCDTDIRDVGTVHWVDHYAVPTNDLRRYMDVVETILGGTAHLQLGLTTQGRMRRQPLAVFHMVGSYHSVGGFLQERMLPEPVEPGRAAPRVGFFVRRADLARHLERLDRAGLAHSDVVEHDGYGEPGCSLYFCDPDGNQYEFWGPDEMPRGAMEADNPTRVGRISHAVLESRDLQRSAEFYSTFCGARPMEPTQDGRLALKLAGGGLLVFEQVDELSDRTGGHNHWRGQHIALTVHDDQFVASYQRFWDTLPESEYVPYSGDGPPGNERDQPPRTELHGLQARGERANVLGRGTFVYDWDGNNFHLVGGIPLDGSMAHYELGRDEKAQIEAGRANAGHGGGS
jgi:catechol 2,3-dioxygenase-like lactoylglutathione lyase family enzyme